MNNEREWEYKGNSMEQNINNEIMIKGNKKNYYKYKDNEKDFEYQSYRKYGKKNDFNEKGRNNENGVYKKNKKKKRENNLNYYENNETYSENNTDYIQEGNNQNVQEVRRKHKKINQNFNQINSKKNFSYHNPNNNNTYNNNNNMNNNMNNNNMNNNNTTNNIINNYNNNSNTTNININEQIQQKNLEKFNFFSPENINYVNNNNPNNNNFNQIINQNQFRNFNNKKQFNNKIKPNNNNNNLTMTTSTIQIPSGKTKDNQIEEARTLNTENSTNQTLSMSLNSDFNYSNLPHLHYSNDNFLNNFNNQISYINEQMYFPNSIPININMFPFTVNLEQNQIFNYNNNFNMNNMNQSQNINIEHQENKKKNNIIGKNKGIKNNMNNNMNNNINLNLNNFSNDIFNQNINNKRNNNKKLPLRKLNSDKNIPMNNCSFFPQNNPFKNKDINQNIQKQEFIFPFSHLILKIKLPNGKEINDILNVNLLEGDFHNFIKKNINNHNLEHKLSEPIYNKIINSIEISKNILSNKTSKFDKIKLEELKQFFQKNNEKENINDNDISIEDIFEYNKYITKFQELNLNINGVENLEKLNYTI